MFSNGGSLGDHDTVGTFKGRDASQGELCEEGGLLGLCHVDIDFLYGFACQGGDGLDTLYTPVVCDEHVRQGIERLTERYILG